MHDIKYIRENPELFDANLNKRGIDASSKEILLIDNESCLLYTSPSPRDDELSRMPSSA